MPPASRVSTSSRPHSSVSTAPSSRLPQSRPVHASNSPAPTFSDRTAIGPANDDFSFLLRPEIYHPLTALNTPTVFRSSSKLPHPSTPLPSLVANGHFRAAAVAAVEELTNTATPIDPRDSRRIFYLVYTRLACLILIGATALAAQEAKALDDLGSARYLDKNTGEHLVPWEMRVLNVRLQSIGFGDPRHAIMHYHDLAREARAHIARARADADADTDTEAAALWVSRLHSLGIRVASALVEMDDLVGAAHHLATLRDRGDGKTALAKALVWLQVGDTEAALRCVEGSSGCAAKIVSALCDMANAAYGSALEKWKALGETMDDEMVAVNTAVCLLYLGLIGEVRFLLTFFSFLFSVFFSFVLNTILINRLGTRPAGKAARTRLQVADAADQSLDRVRALLR